MSVIWNLIATGEDNVSGSNLVWSGTMYEMSIGLNLRLQTISTVQSTICLNLKYAAASRSNLKHFVDSDKES